MQGLCRLTHYTGLSSQGRIVAARLISEFPRMDLLTAPFLKGGIHKRVAKPPKVEGERLCRSCYALAHPTMPRRSTRSANWLEAAMLPATGLPEPASSL